MLIGSDYPKIDFSCFGLELLEPNAMLGDLVICIVSLFFAFKVGKMPLQNTFFVAWRWFFILFAIGFLLGGLGHLMYNYWEVSGKYASWYLGIISVFFIERAMISIHPNKTFVRVFNFVVFGKLIAAVSVASAVFVLFDLKENPSLGLRVPSFNSTVGLLFSLGFLGFFYYKKLSSVFKPFWISVLVLFPAVFFQSLKINLHQWFDKNDASHFLLAISLTLYFYGVSAYQKHLSSDC